MSKMNIAFAFGILAATAAGSAAAEGDWTFLAGTKEGYKAEPVASIILGMMKPDEEHVDAKAAYGLELSLNCPLLQPPTNKIREQVSFTTFKSDDFKQNSIELSPHYVVEVAKGLWLGGGPGLGVVMGEHDGHKETVFGLQVGGSLHYTAAAPFFVGAEARYQFTTDAGDLGDNLNNMRAMVKVGMSF